MSGFPGWVIAAVAFGVLWLALAVVAAGHAIMYKKDPRSSVIWAVVSVTVPVFGAWLYWVMGINRVERRAAKHFGRRNELAEPPNLARHSPDAHREAIAHLHSLRTVADRVTRLPVLAGNTVTPLHTGDQAYPRMLEAIAQAQRSVTLASYIFDWDAVGHDFVRALDDAAERGVRVHVLVDGIGALGAFSRMGRLLIRSGAEVAAFFPLRFPLGRIRLNLRNHRKILVVDGRTGFTGGMNISRRHCAVNGAPPRSEDVHFQITGPVVAEMQHAFVEDWMLATGETLEGEDYFPRLVPTGDALCRGISSGPDENFEIIDWILLAAFAGAAHRVLIVTPYFVPTVPLISAIAMAALRGVDITLMLPSRLDYPFMRWAADAYLWQLLEHGVRVYRRRGPFVHTKLVIVDERWVLLGSANLDPRSLRLNFEFNVEAYDVKLAGELSRWLEERIGASDPVTLDQVDSRPPWHRLRDGLVKLASPYL
jgi:cardiolipin synthase